MIDYKRASGWVSARKLTASTDCSWTIYKNAEWQKYFFYNLCLTNEHWFNLSKLTILYIMLCNQHTNTAASRETSFTQTHTRNRSLSGWHDKILLSLLIYLTKRTPRAPLGIEFAKQKIAARALWIQTFKGLVLHHTVTLMRFLIFFCYRAELGVFALSTYDNSNVIPIVKTQSQLWHNKCNWAVYFSFKKKSQVENRAALGVRTPVRGKHSCTDTAHTHRAKRGSTETALCRNYIQKENSNHNHSLYKIEPRF